MAQSVTKSSVIRQSRGTLENSCETIVIQVNPRMGDIVDSYLEHRSRDVESLLDALDHGRFDQIRHRGTTSPGTLSHSGECEPCPRFLLLTTNRI